MANIIASGIVAILGLTGTAAAVATAVITIASSFALAKSFAPDAPEDPGVTQRVPSSPGNKIPVIYGEARHHGTITYADISSDNKTMAFIISFCEGSIEEIGDMYWDDKRLIFGTGDDGAVVNTIDEDGQNDNWLNGNLTIIKYPDGGRCTQMEAFSNKWASNAINRTMPGVAYVYVELKYDRDDGVTGLTSKLGANIKGRKVRTLNSNGTIDPTEVYTDNPTDCLIDYLTNSSYGAGGVVRDIDLDLLGLAQHKAFCNELSSQINQDGSLASASRYTCNGVVNTNDSMDLVISDFMISAGGNFTYTLGKFGVSIDATASSVAVFDSDNIYGGIQVANPGFDNLVNEVEISFNSKTQNYQDEQVFLDVPQNRRNNNEPTLKSTTRLKFTNNNVEAERVGAILLNQVRNNQTVSFNTDASAIEVQVHDVVTVNIVEYGIADKLYRVLAISETDIGGGVIGMSITAQEYAADDYEDRIVQQSDTAPNTNFPNPRRLGIVNDLGSANIQQVAAVPSFDLTWTVPTDSLVTVFDIYYSFSATATEAERILYRTVVDPDGSWVAAQQITTTITSFQETGQLYFWIRASNAFVAGAFSPLFSFGAWSPETAVALVVVNVLADIPTMPGNGDQIQLRTPLTAAESVGIYVNLTTPALYYWNDADNVWAPATQSTTGDIINTINNVTLNGWSSQQIYGSGGSTFQQSSGGGQWPTTTVLSVEGVFTDGTDILRASAQARVSSTGDITLTELTADADIVVSFTNNVSSSPIVNFIHISGAGLSPGFSANSTIVQQQLIDFAFQSSINIPPRPDPSFSTPEGWSSDPDDTEDNGGRIWATLGRRGGTDTITQQDIRAEGSMSDTRAVSGGQSPRWIAEVTGTANEVVQPVNEVQSLDYTGSRSNVRNSAATTNEFLRIGLPNGLSSTAPTGTTAWQLGVVSETDTYVTGDAELSRIPVSLQITGNDSGASRITLPSEIGTLIGSPVAGQTVRDYLINVFTVLDGVLLPATSFRDDVTFNWNSTTEVFSTESFRAANNSGILMNVRASGNQTIALLFNRSGSSAPNSPDAGASLISSRDESQRYTMDPDTTDQVYATFVNSALGDNADTPAILTEISNSVAALDPNITWDGIVGDRQVAGTGGVITIDCELSTTTGFTFLHIFGNWNSDGSTAGELFFLSSGATATQIADEFQTEINSKLRPGFNLSRSGNTLTLSHPTTGVTFLMQSSSTMSSSFEFGNGFSPIPLISSDGGVPAQEDDPILLAGVIGVDESFVDIDLGTTTNIEASFTYSEDEPTLVVTDGEPGVVTGQHTTYTLTDYAAMEVTAFTSSVTSTADSDLVDVLQQIRDAINNNGETPIDFTSIIDATNDRLLLTAVTPGPVTGLFNVSVNNGGQSVDVGDISFTSSIVAEGATLVEASTATLEFDRRDIVTGDVTSTISETFNIQSQGSPSTVYSQIGLIDSLDDFLQRVTTADSLIFEGQEDYRVVADADDLRLTIDNGVGAGTLAVNSLMQSRPGLAATVVGDESTYTLTLPSGYVPNQVQVSNVNDSITDVLDDLIVAFNLNTYLPLNVRASRSGANLIFTWQSSGEVVGTIAIIADQDDGDIAFNATNTTLLEGEFTWTTPYLADDAGAIEIDQARSANGQVYLVLPSPVSPDDPTADSFDFDTSMFMGLTDGWSSLPVTIEPDTVSSYWIANYTVTELTRGGTQTISIGNVTRFFNFDGIVRFTNTGQLTDGDELLNPSDFITENDLGPLGSTTIDGGRITTGIIDADLITAGTINADRLLVDGQSITVNNQGELAINVQQALSELLNSPANLNDVIVSGVTPYTRSFNNNVNIRNITMSGIGGAAISSLNGNIIVTGNISNSGTEPLRLSAPNGCIIFTGSLTLSGPGGYIPTTSIGNICSIV